MQGVQDQNDILDISSGFLHLAADSLVPASINKNCLKDCRVLQQVDKKFIPVMAGRTLAVIDQVNLLYIFLDFFFEVLAWDYAFCIPKLCIISSTCSSLHLYITSLQ